MLLVFFDRLQRILPFASTVAEEIVCEDTEVLEKIILQVFDVMQRVAKFSCGYTRRGRFGRRPPFPELENADDCSENGRWIRAFEGKGSDRRNEWRVDQDRRGLYASSEC